MLYFPSIHFSSLVLAVLLAVTASCKSDQQNGSAESKLTAKYVLDGDSLLAVDDQAQKIEIRLYGIDAPEKDQPFAQQSKKIAEQLLNNQSIRIKQVDLDRYGRSVAWVYVQGDPVSVNEQLIARGAAWVYRRYANDKSLISLEKKAISDNLGLWALPTDKTIPPWEWRKMHAD